jgi:hypothetical protein
MRLYRWHLPSAALAQIIAGILEYVNGNTFGLVAFTSSRYPTKRNGSLRCHPARRDVMEGRCVDGEKAHVGFAINVRFQQSDQL